MCIRDSPSSVTVDQLNRPGARSRCSAWRVNCVAVENTSEEYEAIIGLPGGHALTRGRTGQAREQRAIAAHVGVVEVRVGLVLKGGDQIVVIRLGQALVVADDVPQRDRIAAAQPAGQAQRSRNLRGVAENRLI